MKFACLEFTLHCRFWQIFILKYIAKCTRGAIPTKTTLVVNLCSVNIHVDQGSPSIKTSLKHV